MNVAGEKAKQAGIQLAYHNHNFEFAPLEGSTGFDTFIERFDKEMVKFELDVFWSSIAGVPPISLMKKLGSSLHLLHLKDRLAGTTTEYDNGKVEDKAFQPLGAGIINMQEVLKLAPELGVKYCMVEQDHSPAILEDIGVSMEYLTDYYA